MAGKKAFDLRQVLEVEGSLSWRHEPHQLAHFLVGTLFSIRVLARGKQDRHVLQDVVKTAVSIFHSFFVFCFE